MSRDYMKIVWPLVAIVVTASVAVGVTYAVRPTKIERLAVKAPPIPVDVQKASAYKCTGIVSLTFDDGPSTTTATLLQDLESNGAMATFFNVGTRMQAHESTVKQEAADGDVIANHTWGHPNLMQVSPATVAAEFRLTQTEIVKVTGQPATMYRPPYGASDDAIRAEASKQGMREVLWTVDSGDWKPGATVQSTYVAASQAHTGDVILMHDGDIDTLGALPMILAKWKSEGLCTAPVPAGQFLPSDPTIQGE